jgi:hypothetical protein
MNPGNELRVWQHFHLIEITVSQNHSRIFFEFASVVKTALKDRQE